MSNAALARWPMEIVAFYELALRDGRLLPTLDDMITIREIESAANAEWYKLGLYEKTGHDYFGVSYHQKADEWGNEHNDYRSAIFNSWELNVNK